MSFNLWMLIVFTFSPKELVREFDIIMPFFGMENASLFFLNFEKIAYGFNGFSSKQVNELGLSSLTLYISLDEKTYGERRNNDD